MVTLDMSHDQLLRFDVGLQSCLGIIIATFLSDSTWLQVMLPIHLVGLDLQESRRTAAVALLGSCNAVRFLSARLLKQ